MIKFGAFGLSGSFDEVCERVQLAEAVGFDGAFFGEHHGGTRIRYAFKLPFIAALAARTQRIKLGTSILLLPLYHPVHVAEDAAIIDNISNGRMILGLGLGYQPQDFRAFGIPFSNRVTLFEEGIEIIRRAWTEETFSFVGRRFSLHNVSITPRPVQQPHPPIWLAAWTEEGVKRAARIGDAYVTDPIQNLRCLKDLSSLYRQLADRRQRPAQVVLMRELLIGESRQEAMDVFGPGLTGTFRYYWTNKAFNEAYDPWVRDLKSAEELTLERVLSERVIAGTPADCAEQIEFWCRETGADYVQLVLPQAATSPHEAAMKAIRLVGEGVIPRLKGLTVTA